MKTTEDTLIDDAGTASADTQSTHQKIAHEHDNLDPISGEPGAHPVGTGLGALGGGASGAAIGSIGGPIGVAIGLVAGAIAGGMAGREVAESIDPTDEDAYWRDNFSDRFYVDPDASYETYRPAYRTGYEGKARFPDKTYEEAEPHLEEHYKNNEGNEKLVWDKARHASREAFERAGKDKSAFPQDQS